MRAKKRVSRTCETCDKEFWIPLSESGREGRGRYCSNACRRDPAATAKRFWALVEKTDSCWLWTGSTWDHGYGEFKVLGERVLAHRYSYELANGPIPDARLVCHKCDVPLCVRPDHLFLGTAGDNNRDAAAKGRARNQNKGKANCKRGHEFTEENTHRHPDGRRECRACMEIHNARKRGGLV